MAFFMLDNLCALFWRLLVHEVDESDSEAGTASSSVGSVSADLPSPPPSLGEECLGSAWT